MSTNLMAASHQWATRPSDERFWGLGDLGVALNDSRHRSAEVERRGTNIRAMAVPNENGDGADLRLTAGNGTSAKFTHWSFNQVSLYAGAPASYLRTLPAQLAADNLNHGLSRRNDDTANVLMHRNDMAGRDVTLRSMNTDKYGRIWNNDIVRSLRAATDNGWMVPPARPAFNDDERARPATLADIVPGQENFGLAIKPGQMIAPGGVYASDRDMFVFMVNPLRLIDDGGKGLMRGFFMWNSEVGAGAFKLQAFYLENVCGNHIVWNASSVKTVRVVHKGNAMRSVADKMGGQLSAFSHNNTSAEVGMIRAARQHQLGSNRQEVIDNLYEMKSVGLSRGDIDAAFSYAERWEHTALSAPVTAWGFSHGLTRYSQTMQHADARTKLDAAGGRILAIAAKSAGVDTKQLALPAPR